MNPRIGAIDDECSKNDEIAMGDCWELRLADCGDKEGGLKGGSWVSYDFWGYSDGIGKALSGGGSIGVWGVKYELVLAEEADLFVDSEDNNGGG